MLGIVLLRALEGSLVMANLAPKHDHCNIDLISSLQFSPFDLCKQLCPVSLVHVVCFLDAKLSTHVT